MEQKRQEVMEQLRRMKNGAEQTKDAGLQLYFMHANFAVEFADKVMELLESGEPTERVFIPGGKSRITIEDNKEKRLYETKSFCFIGLDDENCGKINYIRRVCKGDGKLLLYTGLRKEVEALEKEDKILAVLYEIANGLDDIQETHNELRHDVEKS